MMNRFRLLSRSPIASRGLDEMISPGRREGEGHMWERLEQREIARRDLVAGPGERPRPDLPPGSDLIPKIKHIVVLMMENHSYDNYLGTMTGRGDGLPLGADGEPDAVNALPNGQRIPAHHLPSTA